jgi:hypothetical protein
MSKLYQTTRLPIDEISTSSELQNRIDKTGTDDHHVEHLAQDIAQHGLKTRLIVYKIDGKCLLVSGHHRLEALRRIQQHSGVISKVPVKLYTGTMADAAIHAFRQNLTPGQPLTAREKQQAAYEALLHPSTDYFRNLSYRAAGKQLSVGKSNINTMHNALKVLSRHFSALPDDWKLNPTGVYGEYPLWFKTRRLHLLLKGGEANDLNIMKSTKYQGKLAAKQWMTRNKPLIISNPEDALRTLVTAEELAKSLKHYEAAILDQLAREKSFRDGLSPDVTIARRASKSLGVAPWGDMADLNTPFEYVTDEFEHF